MSIFKKRSKGTESLNSDLTVRSWHELRLLNPNTSQEDYRLGLAWFQEVSETDAATIDQVLDDPVVDGILQVLVPTARQKVEVPENLMSLALDFAQGWLVAELESRDGRAEPGTIGDSALLALSLLRHGLGRDATFANSKFVESGYLAQRLRPDPRPFTSAVLSAD